MGRRALVITLSILLGLNSAVLAEYLGIHIPLVRQIFGFLALTFLPGYLLLNVFRTKLESLSERVFLSVALSISIVMFIGIFANFMYPFLGIKKPITLGPVLITFDAVIMALLYTQQKRAMYMQKTGTYREIKITKWDLFFSLLPLVSLLSAYRFSFYGDNRGLLALYFLLSLTPIVFIKIKDFNRTFAIWSIAISLIWSTVFGMSWDYIWGYDINGEYYYANLVLSHGIWDISTYYQYNTVASVNLLAPIYVIILDIGVVPVFKLIYPLIFSLVPVILLKAYDQILEKRVWAEMSVLFFMFLFTFFTEMMALARQMIAELYLALIIYVVITKKINKTFLVLFGISLLVSHYAISYLMMLALLALILLPPRASRRISNRYAILFAIYTLTWYQYAGGGYQFDKLTSIGYQTAILIKDIFNPRYSQGLAVITGSTTPLRQIAKWLNLISQGLLAIGISAVLYRILREDKTWIDNLEFYALSSVFFIYDIAGVMVPFFANRLNVTRLYQITLLFLSPYLLIGAETLLKFTTSRLQSRVSIKAAPAKSIALFLVIYFIFTSGWAVVVGNDPQPVFWLIDTDTAKWDTSEIIGAKWISHKRYDTLKIYSDQYRVLLFLGLIGQEINSVYFKGESKVQNVPKTNAYVYLGKMAVVNGKVLVTNVKYLGTIREKYYLPLSDSSISEPLWHAQKIYSSDEVWIYKV